MIFRRITAQIMCIVVCNSLFFVDMTHGYRIGYTWNSRLFINIYSFKAFGHLSLYSMACSIRFHFIACFDFSVYYFFPSFRQTNLFSISNTLNFFVSLVASDRKMCSLQQQFQMIIHFVGKLPIGH